MIDADMDDGRDFKSLDAREAQEALAQELSGADEGGIDETEKDKMDEAELDEYVRMAEALLFAAEEPLDEKTIAGRLPADADIPQVMQTLSELYEGRGVNLKRIDKKWRFMTAPDLGHVLNVEKTAPKRLSRAALETLAIIAYHQPCTRADIEDVRGVAVSKGSLDQLLEIGWVKIRGKRRDTPGRPILYGTTDDFLEQYGLETVEDLPGLADLKAAGLLDARLPPGFSVPSPREAVDDEEDGEDGDDAEFAQDFLSEQNGENIEN